MLIMLVLSLYCAVKIIVPNIHTLLNVKFIKSKTYKAFNTSLTLEFYVETQFGKNH